MEPIASLEELAERIEWEMDTHESRLAQGVLEDLSDQARDLGRGSWTATSAPRSVKNIISRAAARYMRNPDGFVQSRAGDETVTWTDRGESSGSPVFTRHEQAAIRDSIGHAGFGSFGTYVYTNAKSNALGEFVPVNGGGKPFPFYADPEGI